MVGHFHSDPPDSVSNEPDDVERMPTPAKGLWGGRFQGAMASDMVPLNLSLDVDRRLWRQDIEGSRAWAEALGRAGVVTQAEARALVKGLDQVESRLLDRGFAEVPDEDIHSLVERLLGEAIGEVAGKLHTGRSRNDQVATDFRLWGMEAGAAVDGAVARLQGALVELARGSLDVIMPGYTHLQQAQPVRAAHWALSHVWPLARDRTRIGAAVKAASVLPLGSGAIAGCPFPVDRSWLAERLGFRTISANSMDAVSDRDWAADLLFAGATVGVHVSRLAEDLILFGSIELGFLRLSDGYSTGSSLMPQKRNPDVAELSRGKAGRLVGNLTGFLTLLKGLPTGYNRDLQEDKEAVFDTVDTLLLVLPALAGAVATARFDAERIRTAMDPQLLATDLADHMVRRGVPFRRAHEAVGRIVRLAEERGVPLTGIEDSDFREAHPSLGPEAREVFDWERSVESRDVPGGTSRRAVEAQLREAEAELDRDPG
jgi:argininosuccinate lyase